MVLSDAPLVAGPIYTRTRPVCLECLRCRQVLEDVAPPTPRVLDSSSLPCTGCSLPLCSEGCQGGPWHRLVAVMMYFMVFIIKPARAECKVFREAEMKEKV